MRAISGLLLSTLFATATLASEMRAGCYLQDGQGKELEGVNVEKRYEIASVSKVMTTFWAVKQIGLKGRYTTTLYIKKLANDFYDVHIVGSRDPYTGMEMFQFLVGQLNGLGIKKIRNMTYDENFKFILDVRASSTAQGHFTLTSPSAERVMREMRTAVTNLSSGYGNIATRAKVIHNLTLPSAISLRVADIHLLEKKDFDPKNYDSAYLYRSAPLHAIVKEMNRNSNNHAANQIFESLGGAEKFQAFIKAELGLEEKDIRFINGSGDRHDLPDGKSMYNEATCHAVVRVVQALQQEMRKSGLSLANVMAVAGEDPSESEKSTVSALYDNDETHKALIAKTGTVNPSVTLAGMISTEEGDIYFGYIYGTNGTVADWRDGRNKIRTQVVKLFNRFGGRSSIDFKAIRFLPFDGESKLKKLENKSPEAQPAPRTEAPSVSPQG
jgi:D-alanyl-D-alanine carboxypeptidase